MADKPHIGEHSTVLFCGCPAIPLDEPLYVIFDGPPSHESGRFVELEDASGRSVARAEWTHEEGTAWWKLGPFYAPR